MPSLLFSDRKVIVRDNYYPWIRRRLATFGRSAVSSPMGGRLVQRDSLVCQQAKVLLT